MFTYLLFSGLSQSGLWASDYLGDQREQEGRDVISSTEEDHYALEGAGNERAKSHPSSKGETEERLSNIGYSEKLQPEGHREVDAEKRKLRLRRAQEIAGERALREAAGEMKKLNQKGRVRFDSSQKERKSQNVTAHADERDRTSDIKAEHKREKERIKKELEKRKAERKMEQMRIRQEGRKGQVNRRRESSIKKALNEAARVDEVLKRQRGRAKKIQGGSGTLQESDGARRKALGRDEIERRRAQEEKRRADEKAERKRRDMEREIKKRRAKESKWQEHERKQAGREEDLQRYKFQILNMQ